MIKTLMQFLRSLFGNTNESPVERVSREAKATTAAAVNSVEAANAAVEAARQAARRTADTALVTIAEQQGRITTAISDADAAEAEAEKARQAEVEATAAEGDAQIQALIRALELARRNADAALEALKAAHDDKRTDAATRRANAEAALAELVRAAAELEAAKS